MNNPGDKTKMDSILDYSTIPKNTPDLPCGNKLAHTKAKVQDNLYKAIDNSKEHFYIKHHEMEEIKIN